MSRAGTKSSQGDDYQRIIALHWVVRLIEDTNIKFIQVESNGIPNVEEKISVDDIVVEYIDGHRLHIQAKKNQSRNRCWSIYDLKDELLKVRDQLESNESTIVELYSRTPFGDLHSVTEASQEYPSVFDFKNSAGSDINETLITISDIWDRSADITFKMLRQLKFGSCLSFSDWEQHIKQNLTQMFSQVEVVKSVLETYINRHQSKLHSESFIIQRKDVLEHLENCGLVKSPHITEVEILDIFQQTSCIGREWQRSIGGYNIPRSELNDIYKLIIDGANDILITDQPGSGKTCLLLDLADLIEQNQDLGLLFIKGDVFSHVRSDKELIMAGLPEDIIGLCSRLSEYRRFVVIIDSLDVLSMNRDHGTLDVFLRHIYRLKKLQNVTIVIACREFDLKYDPKLRDIKWQHTIHLREFDYENVVLPMLMEWGVIPESVNPILQKLLQLPQNLRLFESITKNSKRCDIDTVFDLHEAYLNEVVKKDSSLSEPAMLILRKLADRLLCDRTQMTSLSYFTSDEIIIRRLVSAGVLIIENNSRIGFSHQTLFDTLAAHASIVRCETLLTFIKSHPPFPFLRPSIRSFMFHLRAHLPESFPKQIWETLKDNDVAYHFKRLIVESLAEIIPTIDDWPLVRRLYQHQPELFSRLFWKINGEPWFQLMINQWLPLLQSPSTHYEWYNLLIAQLHRWMNVNPTIVIQLWHRSLSESWVNKSNLKWQLCRDLSEFEHWEVNGVEELIENLLNINIEENWYLGHVISKYIELTNCGDNLLWRYITSNIPLENFNLLDIGNKLHCVKHHFHRENFLTERLFQSKSLLNLAIKSLSEWSFNNGYEIGKFKNSYLYHSSWKLKHRKDDIYHEDGLTFLLDGIESTILKHAKENDEWWVNNEPVLRTSNEVIFRYFLIRAYTSNPNFNIDGISANLIDGDLLRYGDIDYEIGKLIQTSYHLLPSIIQEEIQYKILSLYNNENWGEEGVPIYITHIIYEYLLWIPTVLRLPKSQYLIEKYQNKLGVVAHIPQIHSGGGLVGSPISREEFIALSSTAQFKLLQYYNDFNERIYSFAWKSTGGRDSIANILSSASSYDPLKYSYLLNDIYKGNLYIGYVTGLLEGIANHLRYRFGNLQPSKEWIHIDPPPDKESLILILLDSIEKYPEIWSDEFAIARIIGTCCEACDDYYTAERITFHLFKILKQTNPIDDKKEYANDDNKEITSEDLFNNGINSVRGSVAHSATLMYYHLIEKNIEIPELIIPLLRHFARDPVLSVRAVLLDYLPSITYYRHEIGWQLFSDIYREPQTQLWLLAEQHLYYQYQKYFEFVEPVLNRMLTEAPDLTSEAWGRISTLSALSGYINFDIFIQQIESLKSNLAWQGVVKVLVANIDGGKHDIFCVSKLKSILQYQNLNNQTLKVIDNVFNPQSHGKYIDNELAIYFINAIKSGVESYTFRLLLDWIAYLSCFDAIASLSIIEKLFSKLDEIELGTGFWHTEPLITALSNILREADETDDLSLIEGAIRLQDRFLIINLHGIEDYLEKSTFL